MKRFVYRYTTNGEGVFSAGKRLLPEELVEEVLERKKWSKKPKLKYGNYIFYLTEQGKEVYEKTLLLSHRKYLPNIKLETISYDSLENIIYEDKYQIVVEVKND